MLEKYEKDIELLLMWYEKAKEVTILAESLDTINGVFIQPLHEQRYCLDHFIRAISYAHKDNSEEIVKKAISSAVAHLQRAYSDSVEWTLVSVLDEFSISLEPYTSEQITRGFPKYYSEIRPKIDEITDKVNKYKLNKSVEKASNTNEAAKAEIAEQFVDGNVVKKLKEYLEDLHNCQGALIDIKERDDKKEKEATIKDKIVLPIVTGVIGAVIGALIMFLF